VTRKRCDLEDVLDLQFSDAEGCYYYVLALFDQSELPPLQRYSHDVNT